MDLAAFCGVDPTGFGRKGFTEFARPDEPALEGKLAIGNPRWIEPGPTDEDEPPFEAIWVEPVLDPGIYEGKECALPLVPGLLEVFAFLTPDAPLLDLLVEATAQRAPPFGALELALPALGYTLLVAVLASVPAPAWLASEASA